MKREVIALNKERNVTLTCYIQEVEGEFRKVSKRPAVVILPGGGYEFCSDREADPVAFPYLKAGFQAFILRYSVSEYKTWPAPLQDYNDAVDFILSKKDEYCIIEDNIAVIGFSAGGHLAAAAATMAKVRPNAAILGYAVTGNEVKGCSETAPNIIERVDGDTPPCFLFHTRNDGVVPVMNTIKFEEALCKHGISFESHIYGYGPHGFSTGDSSVQELKDLSKRACDWVEDSIEWLKELFGEVTPTGHTEPKFERKVNANGEAFLSVKCTIGRILGNPKGKAVLSKLEQFKDGQMNMIGDMRLIDALSYGTPDKSLIEMLDKELKQIPNI